MPEDRPHDASRREDWELQTAIPDAGTRRPEIAERQAAIIRPASLIALGSVLSRLLGLARETVMAHHFGATGLVSAYRVAAVVPTMLHDLLVGGMVTSALIPVFSEYADRDRAELWRVASLIISLASVVLGGVTLLGELLAPQIAWLLGAGLAPALQAETTSLMRLTIPAMLFLSLSSILSGLLYAIRRFAFPAFTTAIFNAAIVGVVLVAGGTWGIRSMAVGLLLGAVLQVAFQLPGLHSMQFAPRLDLRDPGVRRILRLSLPVFGGLVISQLAVGIDRHLASRAGEQVIAWMQYATTLIQFPLGIVAVAISLAMLPSLSRYAAAPAQAGSPRQEQQLAAFRTTLAHGLRLVLLLIIPATVGLLLLAEPLVRLLFQHGDFAPSDTVQTARALQVYLIGLTFAAIDQPLISAFYAQQDTLTPAIVGVVGVGIYLAVGLPLLRPLGMIGLVLANSMQWAGHALIMLWLLWRRLGGLKGQGVWRAAAQACLAAFVMAVAVAGGRWQMEALGQNLSRLGQLLTVLTSAGLGGVFYTLTLAALGAEETGALYRRCRATWQSRNSPL